MSEALKKLKQEIGNDKISEEASDLEFYGQDWTRVYKPNPLAIVFPTCNEDLVKIVLWARENSVALVPSGGRTGLSGGSVASQKELVVSFDKMNRVISFQPEDRLLHVEAGMKTEAVQEFLKERNYFFPVDFASRGSSQIGGNVATNAGGTKVIRYGMMREWVAGLKIITGSGTILDLTKALKKDNSGYDLKQIFVGSEGTLGFISEIVLKFTNSPGPLQILLMGVHKLELAPKILGKAQSKLRVTAFEFFNQKALDFVMAQHHLQKPMNDSYPYYFLLEFETDGEESAKVFQYYEELQAVPEVGEVVLSQNETQNELFWKYRELISESISPQKPYKSDISVAISRIPDFVSRADTMIQSQFLGRPLVWFGHVGDGNLHFNFLPAPGENSSTFSEACKNLSKPLFELVKSMGGSISAEHGIGLLKKPYLQYSRCPEEIETMRSIKKIFDPDGILNPGKIFDRGSPE